MAIVVRPGVVGWYPGMKERLCLLAQPLPAFQKPRNSLCSQALSKRLHGTSHCTAHMADIQEQANAASPLMQELFWRERRARVSSHLGQDCESLLRLKLDWRGYEMAAEEG